MNKCFGAAALLLLCSAPVRAEFDFVSTVAIGSRHVAVNQIAGACLGKGSAAQDQALAWARAAWEVRNVDYMRALRMQAAYAAGSLDKKHAGDGAVTLSTLADMIRENARPIVKEYLPSVSAESCKAAIDRLDDEQLDVSKAPDAETAEQFRQAWGPLFLDDEEISFDILPLIDAP